MRPPLILVDGGDLTLFGSESSLINYIESPDIRDYLVFDASGKMLELVAEVDEINFLGFKLNKIVPVKLMEPVSELGGNYDLKLIINNFISRNFGGEWRNLELSQLIEMLETRLGVVN